MLTNPTLRQLAPLFGISKSSADRIIDHIGPQLALSQRQRFRRDAVLIVDGTLVPTRDRSIAEKSKNYRYSTNHQVVIDADTRLVVAVGRPVPGNRNDCRRGPGPGRRPPSGGRPRSPTAATRAPACSSRTAAPPAESGELCGWKKDHNRSHKQVRARVEHVFARMKTWKILRDCRFKGDGVHHAMLGIARLHNLVQAA